MATNSLSKCYWKYNDFLSKISSRSWKFEIYWQFTILIELIIKSLWFCHGQQAPLCSIWRFTRFPYSPFWVHLIACSIFRCLDFWFYFICSVLWPTRWPKFYEWKLKWKLTKIIANCVEVLILYLKYIHSLILFIWKEFLICIDFICMFYGEYQFDQLNDTHLSIFGCEFRKCIRIV